MSTTGQVTYADWVQFTYIIIVRFLAGYMVLWNEELIKVLLHCDNCTCKESTHSHRHSTQWTPKWNAHAMQALRSLSRLQGKHSTAVCKSVGERKFGWKKRATWFTAGKKTSSHHTVKAKWSFAVAYSYNCYWNWWQNKQWINQMFDFDYVSLWWKAHKPGCKSSKQVNSGAEDGFGLRYVWSKYCWIRSWTYP